MKQQDKLDKIYSVIADKTLSLGCRVSYDEDLDLYDVTITEQDCLSLWKFTPPTEYWGTDFIDTNRDNYLVLGHPVMIGDILDWYDFEGTEFAVLEIWKLKRLPIDEQSSECIDYIYSLI